MKTMISRTSRLARDRSTRPRDGTSMRARSRRVRPAVSESRVVLDAGEAVVDIAEFLSNPFDEGAHVDAVPLLAVAGDEVLAAHEVVDLPVGDVGVAGAGQQPHDLEFGQRQVDALAVVEGAIDVDPQFQLAARQERTDLARGIGAADPLRAVGNE